jgi:hypothetical protein
MLRRNLWIVVSLSIVANVAKANDEKMPKLPPRLAVVGRLDEQNGKVILAGVIVQLVPEVREGKNGVRRNVVTPVYETYTDTIALKDTKVFDAAGKAVTNEDVFKRAKAGAVVVISADERDVDPIFLNVLDKNTLVFVSPPRIAPIREGQFVDPAPALGVTTYSPPGGATVLVPVQAPAPAADVYGPAPVPVPAINIESAPVIPQ